jgi:hypothetical protein
VDDGLLVGFGMFATTIDSTRDGTQEGSTAGTHAGSTGLPSAAVGVHTHWRAVIRGDGVGTAISKGAPEETATFMTMFDSRIDAGCARTEMVCIARQSRATVNSAVNMLGAVSGKLIGCTLI